MLEPREVMLRWRPRGLRTHRSQHNAKFPEARKGRRKKSKEQPAACAEGHTQEAEVGSWAVYSCSRGDSQGGSLPQEDLQREIGPPHGRGKPRAWAWAWAAALEKPSSVNLESSTEQASPAKEDPRPLPQPGWTIQANPVSNASPHWSTLLKLTPCHLTLLKLIPL